MLGAYAFYIGAAYALTALVVAALILRAVIDHRAQLRALAAFEARGIRRRSQEPGGTVAAEAAELGP